MVHAQGPIKYRLEPKNIVDQVPFGGSFSGWLLSDGAATGLRFDKL